MPVRPVPGVVALPGPGLPFARALEQVAVGPVLLSLVRQLSADEGLLRSWALAGEPALPSTSTEGEGLTSARAESVVLGDARLAIVQACARLESAVAALKATAVAAAYGQITAATAETVPGAGRGGGAEASARAEMALALRMTERGTAAMVDGALLLTSRHPGTRWLLTEGHLSPAHARVVVDEASVLADESIPALEAVVLRRAPERTVSELRRDLRRAVAKLDPRGAAERHADAVQQRAVRITSLPDGMAEIRALLTADEAQVVSGALDRIARDLPTVDRGFGAMAGCRADALVAVCSVLLDPTADGDFLPALRRTAAPVAVQVQISAATLLGLNEDPAHLMGHGPIPADLGRLLASDGTWQLAITDPDGRLLDLHRLRYQPTAAQRARVAALWLHCGHPTCSVPATRCDVDHTVPFNHDQPDDPGGGHTTCRNLCPRCRLHHNLKTWWGWTTTPMEDGTIAHRTPLGRIYEARPEPQPCAA
ncbi:HNH endonuclease signature motif containing protein [Motilibacter rhizosphaerae]|uniref:HNH endonuclease signature motif containing protein n=1 Tax=Motilibacter rhizosphaerae TaxID=598652 RepID=UPI0013EEAE3D|nr:HNH endonuclease signature motif containing protein [Motilibacter rhizosphaerae]